MAYLLIFLISNICYISCACAEPASPGPDSDTTMDTMEVDSSDLDGGRGLDDPEEPSTPDERMFDMDSPFLDREKDEEPIKTIRYKDSGGLQVVSPLRDVFISVGGTVYRSLGACHHLSQLPHVCFSLITLDKFNVD